MASIISSHNKNLLSKNQTIEKKSCNCQSKINCPLNNNCQEKCIIYKATLSTNNERNTTIDVLKPSLKLDITTTSIASKIQVKENEQNCQKLFGKQKKNWSGTDY